MKWKNFFQTFSWLPPVKPCKTITIGVLESVVGLEFAQSKVTIPPSSKSKISLWFDFKLNVF